MLLSRKDGDAEEAISIRPRGYAEFKALSEATDNDDLDPDKYTLKEVITYFQTLTEVSDSGTFDEATAAEVQRMLDAQKAQ